VENDVPEDIEASTTSATSTLAEVKRGEEDAIAAEDNSFAGHLEGIG
jgi:hypothetical protein